MACIIVKYPNGSFRRFADGVARKFIPGEEIIGVDNNCDVKACDDLNSIFTDDGFMLGNAIKKVTSALGIKQCLSCRGRQRAYNDKGLEIQQKIKGLFE